LLESYGPLIESVAYAGVTAICLVVGAVIASASVPSMNMRSLIQHVAAGFVFAAASVEVLPDVLDRNLPIAAAIGFALGVSMMLLIEWVATKLEKRGGSEGALSWSFVAVVVVDLFVDGILIGVSATAAEGEAQQALLIALALAVELLALGLSMGTTFSESGMSRGRTILITCGVAVAPILGAVAGFILGGVLVGAWVEAVLAFAVAVLLYLAAEELLKEAHEVPETLLSTSLFFAGFLAVLIVDMLAATGGG
jgi:ZIP family zinc transporter